MDMKYSFDSLSFFLFLFPSLSGFRTETKTRASNKKGQRFGETFGRDATSVCSVDPLSDPVKKVPRCGGPVRGDAAKGWTEKKVSKLWRCPESGRLSVSLSHPLISLRGSLYAGPYGRRAYINSALTALRRSFVPICSTRLAQSKGVNNVARRRRIRRWRKGDSPLFALLAFLFHCQFANRFVSCSSSSHKVSSSRLLLFSSLRSSPACLFRRVLLLSDIEAPRRTTHVSLQGASINLRNVTAQIKIAMPEVHVIIL